MSKRKAVATKVADTYPAIDDVDLLLAQVAEIFSALEQWAAMSANDGPDIDVKQALDTTIQHLAIRGRALLDDVKDTLSKAMVLNSETPAVETE